ncbi:MAG: hypothetical protein WCD36_13775 [Rhodanobacteraceae bacterium]
MRYPIFAVLMLAVAACSSVQTNQNGWIEPVDAIRAANNDPAYGVRGTFVLAVKAIGHKNGKTFLDSEADYRDQRNLSIAIPDAVASDLADRLGTSIASLKGQTILVKGVARRIRIEFFDSQGRDSGKYYYQTHVGVTSASQVQIRQN